MARPKSKRPRQGVIQEELGELLTQQTFTILQAMDDGFAGQDKKIEERFIAQNIALSSTMDKQLAQLEKRFIDKLDRLTNTLDRFLKRVTDVEQEFVFMKRIKTILREKLGVTLD